MSSSYLQPVAITAGAPGNGLVFYKESAAHGLGGWEQDDPCRYANQSCKGKMFGALKKCRRKREKSQALCKAHQQKLAEKKQLEQEKQQLMTALQHNVTDTAQQQQTANTALMAGVAAGGLAILGSIVMFARKKYKAKSEPA